MSQVPFFNGTASSGCIPCKCPVSASPFYCRLQSLGAQYLVRCKDQNLMMPWRSSEGKPGHFATTVYILPGTHHLRFLADGIMQTSSDLPTTVDFGNNLVNYIEVNPDALLKAKQRSSGVSQADTDIDASQTDSQAKEPAKPKGKPVPAPNAYASQVPQYLIDFDQPEDSSAYRNAVGAIEKLPTPPSLPGFLGKPILNAATLMKDDNSVLNMPNHTVLNHLATSSIKNNVLAVSATTRYHNKVNHFLRLLCEQTREQCLHVPVRSTSPR